MDKNTVLSNEEKAIDLKISSNCFLKKNIARQCRWMCFMSIVINRSRYE